MPHGLLRGCEDFSIRMFIVSAVRRRVVRVSAGRRYPIRRPIAVYVCAQDSSELTLQYSPLVDDDTFAALLFCQVAPDPGAADN